MPATTIQEIIDLEKRSADSIIADLKEKSVDVPAWRGRFGLIKEYEPKMHPVMNKAIYPDIVREDGSIEYVSRVPLNFQKLSAIRMSELCFSIPVKRIYKAHNDDEKFIASILEKIYERNRINSVNIERGRMLFAGCEVATLWYAVPQPNDVYGFDSELKLRCKNYSPMNGDDIYPLFDETGDMIALSFGYKRNRHGKSISYFDTYTDSKHLKWVNEGGGNWTLIEDEDIMTHKIPGIYGSRPSPIWEDTSETVYESEWVLSRNGNYLRKNSKPLFVVCSDEEIEFGTEGDEKSEFRDILQYPMGATANYATWQQAIESLKFHVNELRQLFFTQLQLPDWSYEKMSQQALSGESRKQLFIDAQLKVGDESGRLLEFLDRELNVIKSFLKLMLPESYHKAIDSLQVEMVITPFTITDEKDTIANLVNANGGKPIISQRESIQVLGWSDDPDKTMAEIRKEGMEDLMEATL